ncbi:MAG: YfiO protein [Parachlamydiales bacterium]|nr:YfiO protein [Parachlamydiales bacterium]
MRWHLCILPFFFFQPIANAAISEPQNEEEALFIRRIADFWQEGEYQIVKKQIEEFLREYPESSMAQSLSATLGDLYIREKNYQGALAQYARINDPALLSRTFLNRMQCLFDLQWFATLADECEEFLKQADLDPDLRQGATYFLAIALYQQCLNTPKESETLQRLAARAQPHFQFLLQSALSQDVAQAFAHLSCILKDFVSASQIYLRLAEQNNSNREEMLFQAAVMQAEFDKPLAQQTFEEISTMGQKRSHDALYNRLVLSYDLGQYEEVLIKKDALLAEIPPERQEALHLFFGRSHLHLNQYPEALQELQLYAKTASASETLRSALVDMLEVAYLVSDESGLKQTLNRLLEEFPDDKQIPKGFLAHAMLLKKSEKFNDALQELETIRTRFSSSEEIEPALFEQIQIEHQQNRWTECSQHSREFVQKFPKNTLAPYAWRYLATAMAHLADNSDDPLIRETLAQDLESMLAQDKTQTEQEYGDWSFLLGQLMAGA